MRVSPMAPGQIQASNIAQPAASDRREAAIKAFTQQGQPAQQPVVDATRVSPEEMSALQPENQEIDTPTEIEAEVPQVEEKKPDTALSKQFAQLARQEKALRAQAQRQAAELKAKEDAILAREQAMKAKDDEYSQKYVPKDRFKTDPLNTLLNDLGLSYDELAQAMINHQPTDPRVEAMMSKADQRIAQLEAKLEEANKAQVVKEEQARQNVVKQIRADVSKLVFTDPAFETIKATNSIADVVELIEKSYDQDGQILSNEEACQMVEDYLIDEALKLSKLSKIQKRLLESASSTQVAAKVQPQPSNPKQPQPMKTLTNNVSSSRKLSAKERAILAFKGELKS